MGFLQLIPAQQIKAVYYATSRTLSLQARGDAQNFTSGIAFHARPDAGRELVFALMGWVGPLGQGRRAYEQIQRFDNLEFPGDSITVEDSNHPNGAQIPVEIIAAALASDAGGAPAQEVMRIPLGGAFDLRAPTSVPLKGTVTITYDHAYLLLENAGIQNPGRTPEIAWNLKGTKLGETLVKITTSGGIAQYLTTRNVKVVIEPVSTK